MTITATPTATASVPRPAADPFLQRIARALVDQPTLRVRVLTSRPEDWRPLAIAHAADEDGPRVEVTAPVDDEQAVWATYWLALAARRRAKGATTGPPLALVLDRPDLSALTAHGRALLAQDLQELEAASAQHVFIWTPEAGPHTWVP